MKISKILIYKFAKQLDLPQEKKEVNIHCNRQSYNSNDKTTNIVVM